jgi:prepilin-type N-terminal cleavage/methylation domain-containing protein
VNIHDRVSISNLDRVSEPVARSRRGQEGFTLTELIIGVFVIGMLAMVVINNAFERIEEARLARCMVELRGIQAAVLMDSNNGRSFMDPQTFWSSHYHGHKPGPYVYLLDGDPNNGHGNDLDGVDEENPGASDPDKKDIKFVVMCQHDHKWLGEYVYLTDEEPPHVVGGRNGGADPGYDRFAKWEFGGPGGDST